MKSYVKIAKKRQNEYPTSYKYKNESGNRGSVYPVEDEFDCELIVHNNVKNIHRISTSNIKLPYKETQITSIPQSNPNLLQDKFKENNTNFTNNLTPQKVPKFNLNKFIQGDVVNKNTSVSSNNLPIIQQPENYSNTRNRNNNRSPLQKYIFNNLLSNSNNLSQQPSPKKINNSFDSLKIQMKKGMFSYPKTSSTTVSTNYHQISNNNFNHQNESQIKIQNNISNNQSENGQLYHVPSNSLLIDSSSNLSIPRNFSIERSPINDSTTSIFNKYKIGLGTKGINQTISNSNFFAGSNSDVSSIWGQINNKKEEENSKNQEKDKFHTFSGNNELKIATNAGTHVNITKANNTPSSNSQNNHSIKNISSKLKLKNTPSSIIYKNKPQHQKENRRMLLEMVKLKATKKGKSVNQILEEMNLDSSILCVNKPVNINDNTSLMSMDKGKIIPNNQPTTSLEIKNNNFEINNNYYGTINIPPSNNSNGLTISKTIPQFFYHMNEDSSEKTNQICYLTIPRILSMKVGSAGENSFSKKTPFIFQISPSNLSFTCGFEHYIFQWNDMKTIYPVGSIDILNIVSCSGDNVSNLTFSIEVTDNNRYEITTNNPEECKLYINALNYLSQLIKCKAYSLKGKNRFKK